MSEPLPPGADEEPPAPGLDEDSTKVEAPGVAGSHAASHPAFAGQYPPGYGDYYSTWGYYGAYGQGYDPSTAYGWQGAAYDGSSAYPGYPPGVAAAGDAAGAQPAPGTATAAATKPATAAAPAPAKKGPAVTIPSVPKTVQTIKLPPPPPAPAPEPAAQQASASASTRHASDTEIGAGNGDGGAPPSAAPPAPAVAPPPPAVSAQEDLNDFQRRMMEMMNKKKEDAEKKQGVAEKKQLGTGVRKAGGLGMLKGAKMAIVPPSGLRPALGGTGAAAGVAARAGDAAAAAGAEAVSAAFGRGRSASPKPGGVAGAGAGAAVAAGAQGNGVHADARQALDGVPRRMSPARDGDPGRRGSRSPARRSAYGRSPPRGSRSPPPRGRSPPPWGRRSRSPGHPRGGMRRGSRSPYGPGRRSRSPVGPGRRPRSPYGPGFRPGSPFGPGRRSRSPLGPPRRSRSPYGPGVRFGSPPRPGRRSRSPYGGGPGRRPDSPPGYADGGMGRTFPRGMRSPPRGVARGYGGSPGRGPPGGPGRSPSRSRSPVGAFRGVPPGRAGSPPGRPGRGPTRASSRSPTPSRSRSPGRAAVDHCRGGGGGAGVVGPGVGPSRGFRQEEDDGGVYGAPRGAGWRGSGEPGPRALGEGGVRVEEVEEDSSESEDDSRSKKKKKKKQKKHKKHKKHKRGHKRTSHYSDDSDHDSPAEGPREEPGWGPGAGSGGRAGAGPGAGLPHSERRYRDRGGMGAVSDDEDRSAGAAGVLAAPRRSSYFQHDDRDAAPGSERPMLAGDERAPPAKRGRYGDSGDGGGGRDDGGYGGGYGRGDRGRGRSVSRSPSPAGRGGRKRRGRSRSRSSSRSSMPPRSRSRGAAPRGRPRSRSRSPAPGGPRPRSRSPAAASALPPPPSQPPQRRRRWDCDRSVTPEADPRASSHPLSKEMAAMELARLAEAARLATLTQQMAMPASNIALQNSRHARRVYVGGLAPGTTEATLNQFFNNIMVAAGACSMPGLPVLSVYINHEKRFAFVEFRTVEEASNSLAFDGVALGSDVLKIRRPHDYNAEAARPLGPSEPNPRINLSLAGLGVINTVVEDGPNKVLVGGLPTLLTEDQVRELLQAFGTLRGFNLITDRESGASKGYCFCEYLDPNVTDVAIQGLSSIVLAGKALTVRRTMAPPPGAAEAAPLPPPPATGKHAALAAQGLPLPPAPPLPGSTAAPAPPAGGAAPPAGPPDDKCVVRLSSMVTREDLLDDEEYSEILDETREEVSKYGKLREVVIPKPSREGVDKDPPGVGLVFLFYEDARSAERARVALHGREFGGQAVDASIFSRERFDKRDFS